MISPIHVYVHVNVWTMARWEMEQIRVLYQYTTCIYLMLYMKVQISPDTHFFTEGKVGATYVHMYTVIGSMFHTPTINTLLIYAR